MGGELQEFDRDAAGSLINWWLEAGVDTAVEESPRDWLGQRKHVPAKVSEPLPQVTRPADLAEFQAHLANGPGLPMDRPGAIRIAPVGIEAAPIMLLTDMPSREDAAEGRPMAGEAWTLAERMLAAIGLTTDEAYLASLSPFHAPGARFNGELAACAEIARAHIKLARPARLILFGDAPARALLDEPLARARGRVHRVEGIRTIATFHPRWLLQRPTDKALAWRDLLLLMSESD